jgi:uncharacterized protein (TIGR02996 family)
MNADLAALLDHCRRNPDDETRLILADWLEEQGDALDQQRARMIRAEIEALRLCRARDRGQAEAWLLEGRYASRTRRARWSDEHERAEKLLREVDSLARAHQRAWLGELTELRGVHEWLFDRGMVYLVVSFMFLHPRGINRLYGQDGWPWVEGLRCHVMGDAGAVALAECPHLASLGWLDMPANKIGRRGGRALASSPHLERLTRLDLRDTPELTSDVVAALRQRFGTRVLI